MKRSAPYILSASSYLSGIGLTITSAWLITMASGQPPLVTLSIAIVGVRFFGILRSLTRYLERLTSHRAVFQKLGALRAQLFSAMSNNPIALVRDVGAGVLVKRVVDDVERAQEYQLRVRLPHGSAVIALLCGSALGGWLRPASLVITVPVSLLLLLYIPSLIKKRCEVSAQRIESLESRYSALLQESAHGMAEAKLYGYLDERLARTAECAKSIWQEEGLLLRQIARFQFIFVGLMGFTLLSLTFIAARLSERVPHVQISMLIFLPLVLFESVIALYPNLFTAGKMRLARREISLLSQTHADKTVPTSRLSEPFTQLVVTDLHVDWSGTEHFMQPLSFTLRAGETVIVRGRSGTGKSTLAMGLVGLLNYAGSATINNVEIREFANLSDYVTGALQSGHLFNTSLRENMKIAAPTASDAEIMQALLIVELDTLVGEMAQGLDTILGDYGRPLSGGEAKRLGVARALLSPAALLILDEPTEHLDSPLAMRIEERILGLKRSLLVITHSGWEKGTKSVLMQR